MALPDLRMDSGPEPSPGPLVKARLDGSWTVVSALGLALVVAFQAFLLRALFHPGEPVGQDLSIHLAEIAELARSLAAGDPGLWNPSGNLGAPSGYYYQLLPQLVPAVAYLLLGKAVPLLVVFKVSIAAPLVLLPLAVHRALRQVGVGAAAAVGGAAGATWVVAGIRWGAGLDGALVAGLYTQAWAILFTPLALAAAYRFLRHGERPARAAGLVLVVGLCHPLLAVMLPVALLATPWWRAGASAAGRRAAALAAATLAASAFFWIPVLVHYDSYGGFPVRAPDEAGIAPGELVRLLARGGLLDAGRLPVLTLFLAIAAVRAFWPGTGVLRSLLAQGVLFAALLAGGTLVHVTADDLVPGIRALVPLQLAWGSAAGLAAAGALAAGWSRAAALGPRSRALARGAVALAAIAVAAAAAAGPWARSGQVVFTSADRMTGARAELERILAALAPRPPGRVVALTARGHDYWASYLPSVYAGKPALHAAGGSTFSSSANTAYVQRARSEHQRLYAARYFIVPREQVAPVSAGLPPPVSAVAATESYALLEVPSAMVDPVRVVGAAPAERGARRPVVESWLAGPGPLTGEHLEIGGAPGAIGPAPQGEVLSYEEGPSRYAAEVVSRGAQPTTFVVRATFHPGWRATLDGAAVPIRRLTPDFPAVDVPPGRHVLELRFRRPAWTWALLAGSLALLAGLAARDRRAPRA